MDGLWANFGGLKLSWSVAPAFLGFPQDDLGFPRDDLGTGASGTACPPASPRDVLPRQHLGAVGSEQRVTSLHLKPPTPCSPLEGVFLLPETLNEQEGGKSDQLLPQKRCVSPDSAKSTRARWQSHCFEAKVLRGFIIFLALAPNCPQPQPGRAPGTSFVPALPRRGSSYHPTHASHGH